MKKNYTLSQMINYIKDWTKDVDVNIPSLVSFGIGFLSSIMDVKNKRVSFIVDDIETARWRPGHHEDIIEIPAFYFDNESYNDISSYINVDLNYLVALKTYGALVHEIMHHKLTSNKMPVLDKGINAKLFYLVNNVVEDLYINHNVDEIYEPFVYYHYYELLLLMKQEKISDTKGAINFLITCNVPLVYDNSAGEIENKLKQMILPLFENELVPKNRQDIAKEITLFLQDNFSENDIEQAVKESGKNGLSDLLNDKVEKAQREDVVKIVDGIVVDVNSKINAISYGGSKQVEYIYPKSRQAIPVKKGYEKIGSILRAITMKQRRPLVCSQSGRKIRNSRINRYIDGRIFRNSKAIEKDKTPNIKVTIISDSSGSTNMHYAKNKTVFDAICEATKGMFISLRNARIHSEVFFHSGRRLPGRSVAAIFRAAVFDERRNENNIDDATGIAKHINFDHLVINEVVSNLPKNEYDVNIIFVLSDGIPNSASDLNPEDELKKLVDKLRKDGIIILSLSVVEDVIEENNYIYGDKYNFDLTVDINNKIQKILLETIKREIRC